MKNQHMNPDDAVMAHILLRSKQSVGIHFATFAEHPEQAIDALYALPSRDALPEAARAALGAHLGPQAIRDVLPLTRSKLHEISKG